MARLINTSRFEQSSQKQLKPIYSSPSVETAIFPIVIRQILLHQTSLDRFSLPANFEAIAQQTSRFIAQANPFAERFCHIEDLMQNSIQMENDWLQHAKFLRFDDDCSMQSSVVLQASFAVFFDLAPHFECLSVERVESLLDYLFQDVAPSCPFPDIWGRRRS
jgi:hypothetical protein